MKRQLTSVAATLFAIAVSSSSAIVALGDDPTFTIRAAVDKETSVPVYGQGIVRATKYVELAAPFHGVVARLQIQPGSFIAAGSSVAKLDDRIAKASVEIAEHAAGSVIEIQLAESRLVEAEKFAQRVGKAHRHSAASELELDKARASVEYAKRMVDRAHEQKRAAEARLKLEQAKLDEHTIRAPFDAIVLDTWASEGQTVEQSEKILSLADISLLAVDIEFPAYLYGKIQERQAVSLIADVPVNRIVHARVGNISPQVNSKSKTFRCELIIENQQKKLPIGFSVRLHQHAPGDPSEGRPPGEPGRPIQFAANSMAESRSRDDEGRAN